MRIYSVRDALGRELWWTTNKRKAREWMLAREDNTPAPYYGPWMLCLVTPVAALANDEAESRARLIERGHQITGGNE